MPRIDPKMLDCVVYLYDSAESAATGENCGGTGFIVSAPFKERPDLSLAYCVTNWHVAVQQGNVFIRINKLDGGTEIAISEPHQWQFNPKFDIAIIEFPFKHDVYKMTMMPIEGFLTEPLAAEKKVGPGDSVFMVGRFMDHDGKMTNVPAVRFGHISVNPAPIKQEIGPYADAYCIDLHSRPGHSGSPVFVYRLPGYDLETAAPPSDGTKHVVTTEHNMLMLLGIHFAQFPERWQIGKTGLVTESDSEPLIREGAYVKGMSGMTCVLPAWNIRQVLEHPKFQEHRRRLIAQAGPRPDSHPVSESEPSTKADNPSHKEDFSRLLDAAVKGPKSSQ
jgi:hypothetical protein